MTKDEAMKTTINGREMNAETIETGPRVAADLAARGWEPTFYALTGKRGASYLAVRSATTGAFVVTNRA